MNNVLYVLSERPVKVLHTIPMRDLIGFTKARGYEWDEDHKYVTVNYDIYSEKCNPRDIVKVAIEKYIDDQVEKFIDKI